MPPLRPAERGREIQTRRGRRREGISLSLDSLSLASLSLSPRLHSALGCPEGPRPPRRAQLPCLSPPCPSLSLSLSRCSRVSSRGYKGPRTVHRASPRRVSTPLYRVSSVSAPLYRVSSVSAPLYRVSGVSTPLYRVSGVSAPLYRVSGVSAPLYRVSGVSAPLYRVSSVSAPLYRVSGVSTPCRSRPSAGVSDTLGLHDGGAGSSASPSQPLRVSERPDSVDSDASLVMMIAVGRVIETRRG
jgi:hypothetical protein